METPSTPARDPLERRPLLRFLRGAVRNWLLRHREPFNFWLHMVGIPMSVAGVGLLCYQQWLWGAAVFVGGYVLQYIGHLYEGNDLGEWAGIKRLLGLPYVDIAPRWRTSAEEAP